jgi:hypothetical protein
MEDGLVCGWLSKKKMDIKGNFMTIYRSWEVGMVRTVLEV